MTPTPDAQPTESTTSADVEENSGKIDLTKRLAYVSQEKSIGVIEAMEEPADIAALRERVQDTTEMKFLRVSVDNRRGGEAAEIGIVTGIDENGKKYTFGPLQNYILEVMMDPSLSDYEDAQGTLQEQLSQLGDKYEKIVWYPDSADVVLVTTDLPLPEYFESMEISPHYLTLEEVVPLEDVADQAPLDFEVPEENRR
ncbi:hypothetical protein [Micrococcoides hystricis]|uniref:Uncharacterized protein n=1 Tax=Micrococcoides hystricis TaxID=1572761 RepID=A0ABV6P9D1_9MICC